MEWATEKRRGKVFVDHNQNTRGKTLAAQYSLRPSPEAAVSAPITWEELQSVYPTDFDIDTVPDRLAAIGDLWADILSAKQDLRALLGTALRRHVAVKGARTGAERSRPRLRVPWPRRPQPDVTGAICRTSNSPGERSTSRSPRTSAGCCQRKSAAQCLITAYTTTVAAIRSIVPWSCPITCICC
jgi:hypothetical protein